MGAADLDDPVPRLRLGGEFGVHGLERRQQHAGHLSRGGDVHRAREGVVRRLAHVDVIVGMHRALGAELAAEREVGLVGDDLVGVHVALGARAGLPHDQRKLGVELAIGNLGGRGLDRVGELGVQQAELAIGPRRRALDQPQRVHQRQRHPLPADAEVLQGSLRLRAPQPVGRDGDFAHGVGFDAGLGHAITGKVGGEVEYRDRVLGKKGRFPSPWAYKGVASDAEPSLCVRRRVASREGMSSSP